MEWNIGLYYIDVRVNWQIYHSKIHEDYIQDPSGLFSIISHKFLDDVILVISLCNMSSCLYNKKNITRQLEDMNFIFSCQKHFTRWASS